MRKYSKEQKAYIEAKKALDILEAQEKKMEADFVKSLGIINEDGSTRFSSAWRNVSFASTSFAHNPDSSTSFPKSSIALSAISSSGGRPFFWKYGRI